VSIVAVVGLAFEARIAARAGTTVVCSGGGRLFAAALDRAIGKDCRGLVSFGVAGGLSPRLEAGTCVVGAAILSGAARYATDATWSRSLLQAIPGAVHGAIVGVPAPIMQPEDKHALFRTTGALAVDTESHVVARLASACALPMVAVRVIVDPAAHRLPRCALAAVRPDGGVNVAAIAVAAIADPAELAALPRIALAAHAARTTLSRSCRLLGRDFGFPDQDRITEPRVTALRPPWWRSWSAAWVGS
jgi:adenosylhomocysteine nucleosidase